MTQPIPAPTMSRTYQYLRQTLETLPYAVPDNELYTVSILVLCAYLSDFGVTPEDAHEILLQYAVVNRWMEAN